MLNLKSRYPIGIDIGGQNIYAVQLKQTRQGFAVRALARLELDGEAGSVPDDGQSLLAAVKKMSKNRHFRGKSVALHIPLKHISVFPIRFSAGKSESVEEAIVRESERYLSFPLKEAVLDYASLTSAVDGDVETYKATVIAVRREHIDYYLGLMKQAGLVVEAVDYRVSSLIRLHRHLHQIAEHPVILCNIGYTESLLAVVTCDSILAQRVIPWGAKVLVEKILANLELLNVKANASLLLKTHGLAYDDSKSADNGAERFPDTTMLAMRRAIYQVITPAVDDFIYEFQKMISYVRSERQHPFFEGIYMYGHAALIRHLDRYLGARLNLPANCINPLTALALADDAILPDISEGAPFALALGLAMRKVQWL